MRPTLHKDLWRLSNPQWIFVLTLDDSAQEHAVHTGHSSRSPMNKLAINSQAIKCAADSDTSEDFEGYSETSD